MKTHQDILHPAQFPFPSAYRNSSRHSIPQESDREPFAVRRSRYIHKDFYRLRPTERYLYQMSARHNSNLCTDRAVPVIHYFFCKPHAVFLVLPLLRLFRRAVKHPGAVDHIRQYPNRPGGNRPFSIRACVNPLFLWLAVQRRQTYNFFPGAPYCKYMPRV